MQITPKYNKHLLKDAVLLLATPPPGKVLNVLASGWWVSKETETVPLI